MSRRLRVGLVGLGFGQAHLATYLGLADRFEVVAVCDHTGQRVEDTLRWFRGPVGVTSFDELLGMDDIDVVDITTPPTTHFPMAEAALATGRHVICEKPLAASLAEVDRLAELEAEARGRLMPIFQYRFGNGAARLRRLLAADVLGDPYVASVETSWTRGEAYYASPWRGRLDAELGGVCAMHAIHAYDLLLTILGPLRSVYARTATRVNDIETEDCAAVVLEFASGALATLTATLGSAREMSRMRLHFARASVETGTAPYAGSSEPWIVEPASPESAARIDEALADFRPGRDLLDQQLAEFADALADGGELPVTIATARPAIELLTAIYESAATGAPVDVPIGVDHPAYRSWSIPKP